MSNCVISIIVPTYKPKDYLWECLASIKNQTYSKADFELVIVLNGCDEPYRTEIIKYNHDNLQGLNVKFLHTLDAGVSNARNLGLDVARGEYIVFIDDDDFISPTYLEELFALADKETVSLCYPLAFVDGSKRYSQYSITQDYNKYHNRLYCKYTLAKRYFSGPVYKMIHKDIIGNRRFDVKFKNGEDSIFMFLISDRMKNVAFTSKNAIYYRRIREGSAVSSPNHNERLINCLRLMRKYLIIYCKGKNYHFGFFITRELGIIHSLLTR